MPLLNSIGNQPNTLRPLDISTGFFANTTHQQDFTHFADLALWFISQHSLSSMQLLTTHFDNAQTALSAPVDTWQALGIHDTHIKRRTLWDKGSALRKSFDSTVQDILQQKIHLVRFNDTHYPPALKNISDPPPFLFVRGNPDILFQPQISIVGSRKPSPTGKTIAFEFAKALAEQGLWITSGLAHGIDTESHLGALAATGGRTIAVLGTGILQCYPESNAGLYQRIIDEGGAIVSEFIPNTPPQAHNFPRRNRIVSGMSLGVLVVEAALKSGSLITAKLGAEQGKLVFAVPGHIHNQQAKGCHLLIREGAILVDEPAHILEDLNLPRRWHHAETEAQTLTPAKHDDSTEALDTPTVPAHLQKLLSHIDWTGLSMDTLVDTSGLAIASLSSQMMELELLGYVVQQNGLYQRCRV